MGYTLHISGSSAIQNPLSWGISDPVQSKSAWTGLDYESSGLIQSIPYSGADPLFSIGCQLFAFIWKFYEGKKSYFGRRVFIFVLTIRNKSSFSGKIITSFKIERMTLNLLAIWPKHKIEMQLIYDGRKDKFGNSCPRAWISENGAQGNIAMGLLL